MTLAALIEQFSLLRPGYGRIAADVVFGQRCYAVRSAAVTRAALAVHQQKTACQPCTARNNERRRDARRAGAAPSEATAQQRRRRELAVEALCRDARRESAPSPRHRVVSLAGIKRSRSGDDDLPSKRQLKEEAQERRRQLLAAPLPAPRLRSRAAHARADAGAGTDRSCDLARPDALAPGGRRFALSAAAAGTEAAEVTLFVVISV